MSELISGNIFQWISDLFSGGQSVKKDPKSKKDYKFRDLPANKTSFKDIPEKIDLSSKMSIPINQGKLGSCVGCAGTAIMQYWDNKKEGSNSSDLSEQYLYWNCEEIDNHAGEGTWPKCAMQVLKKKGIPIDRAWPYIDKFEHNTSPESWADEDASKRKIVSYYRITTLKQLLKALSSEGPTLASVFINTTWYEKGRKVFTIQKHPRILGAHAICLCGYDQTTQKIKFINSWGNTWGENGYGWMTFEYFKKYKLDCWVPLLEGE